MKLTQKVHGQENWTEPLAELTEMEWVMMSRGRESDIVSALNTRASVMKNMKK